MPSAGCAPIPRSVALGGAGRRYAEELRRSPGGDAWLEQLTDALPARRSSGFAEPHQLLQAGVERIEPSARR